MLVDISHFFGDVTPQGAIVLLLVGLLTGFGLHDVIAVLWNCAAHRGVNWYGGKHEDTKDDDSAP